MTMMMPGHYLVAMTTIVDINKKNFFLYSSSKLEESRWNKMVVFRNF